MFTATAEYDANDNLIAVFNGGYMVKNGTTFRLLRDHIGSVRLVVDASTGSVAQKLSYGPWGEVLEDTNPGFQPFGFAGGLYDPDTGLVRFGARDFDPSVGRWTCKDPLGVYAGANLYEYVANNPVNSVDPTGLAGVSRAECFAMANAILDKIALYWQAEKKAKFYADAASKAAGGHCSKEFVLTLQSQSIWWTHRQVVLGAEILEDYQVFMEVCSEYRDLTRRIPLPDPIRNRLPKRQPRNLPEPPDYKPPLPYLPLPLPVRIPVPVPIPILP